MWFEQSILRLLGGEVVAAEGVGLGKFLRVSDDWYLKSTCGERQLNLDWIPIWKFIEVLLQLWEDTQDGGREAIWCLDAGTVVRRNLGGSDGRHGFATVEERWTGLSKRWMEEFIKQYFIWQVFSRLSLIYMPCKNRNFFFRIFLDKSSYSSILRIPL